MLDEVKVVDDYNFWDFSVLVFYSQAVKPVSWESQVENRFLSKSYECPHPLPPPSPPTPSPTPPPPFQLFLDLRGTGKKKHNHPNIINNYNAHDYVSTHVFFFAVVLKQQIK